MRIPFAFVVALLLGITAAHAEELTAPTLVGWCQDARAMVTGLKVMPVAQVSQIQSNATSCVGYLRGYLDSEFHIRSLVPQMGSCAAEPGNEKLVAIFLQLAESPGWRAMPLRDLMVAYSNQFCPVAPPTVKTTVQLQPAPTAVPMIPQTVVQPVMVQQPAPTAPAPTVQYQPVAVKTPVTRQQPRSNNTYGP